MEVEIKSGFTLWISFIDVKRNEQIALAIYDNKKQCYIGRIRNPTQQALFNPTIDEFSYQKNTKEWDIVKDLKRRIEKLYGKVTYIDNTFRWPMSKKMLDEWETQYLRSAQSNKEHWEKERAKLAFARKFINPIID